MTNFNPSAVTRSINFYVSPIGSVALIRQSNALPVFCKSTGEEAEITVIY